MVNSLWNGVSGLASQQKALDNESNNIANVNTVGYKASRISFADQFYQDKIGKGSKVLDAEKLFTVSTTKSTGVTYDMALKGDGFFIVADKRQGGSSPNYYTRAGNFRMGSNGTLQDPIGNEVQGWKMSSIDQDKDVLSTSPNSYVFTKEYKNVLASKIIKHSSSVESIAMKATDYENTAKADSSIFSGAGKKSAKAKKADVQEAQKNYNYWLDKLKNEPDAPSSSASSQISEINFKTNKNDSVIRNKNDQIYVVIEGERISQEFVVTSASKSFIEDVWKNMPTDFKNDYNLKTEPKDLFKENLSKELQKEIETYNILAGRVETYKKLADKISEKSGMVAYTASETLGANEDVLENEDIFRESTKIKDALKGIIEIKSLIPGKSFRVSDVGEVGSGNSSSKGNILHSSIARTGSGLGAVESARQALLNVITGKQEDVYTPIDLGFDKSPMFNFSINIYDKELKKNIPVPNDNGKPLKEVPILIDSVALDGKFTVDAFIDSFNKESQKYSPKLTDYIEAVNINNNLLIRTLDKNIDVEFTTQLKQLPTYTINLNEIVDNSMYNFDLDINGDTFPIQIDYTTKNSLNNETEQENIRNEVLKKVNEINANNPDYHLGVTKGKNGIFSIYTKNETIDFSNSKTSIDDKPLPKVGTLVKNVLKEANVTYEEDKIIITEPLSNTVYSINVMGETIRYDNTSGTSKNANEIINSFKTQISSNPNLTPYMKASVDSIGTPGDGAVLSNGLDNLSSTLKSSPEGNFMIEIPAGIENLTIYLDEFFGGDIGGGDTIQIFTKDGKHISGTLASDEDWRFFKEDPANIVLNNPKRFNVGAVYDSSSFKTHGGLDLAYYGPYTGDTNSINQTVSYIDKNGALKTRVINKDEEMITIKNVKEPLVIFINGGGIYQTAAEWKDTTTTNKSSSLVLTQTALKDPSNPMGLNITNSNSITNKNITNFNYEPRVEHRFTIDPQAENPSSIYTLHISGKEFEIKTGQKPDKKKILDAFKEELKKDLEWNQKYQLKIDGSDLVIQDKFANYGFVGFTQDSDLKVRSLTEPFDEYKTVVTHSSKVNIIEANENHSGRAGANAELIEIKTNIDQLSTKDSLQLRFDNLKISDSAFGKFEVDNTGLVTMDQDGIKIAIGQVAVARFANNRALEARGDNLFSKTTDSGDPIIRTNNDGVEGIRSKTLELSGADLSESLVNLMVFQKAFEANAKTITTSDQILNTLINIKR